MARTLYKHVETFCVCGHSVTLSIHCSLKRCREEQEMVAGTQGLWCFPCHLWSYLGHRLGHGALRTAGILEKLPEDTWPCLSLAFFPGEQCHRWSLEDTGLTLFLHLLEEDQTIIQCMTLAFWVVAAGNQAVPKLRDLEQESFVILYDSIVHPSCSAWPYSTLGSAGMWPQWLLGDQPDFSLCVSVSHQQAPLRVFI